MKGSIVVLAAVAAIVAAGTHAQAPAPPPLSTHIQLVVDGTPLGPLAHVEIIGMQDEPDKVDLASDGAQSLGPLGERRKSPSLTFVATGHVNQLRRTIGKWSLAVRHAILAGNRAQGEKQVQIEIVDDSGNAVAAWTVTGAYPKRIALTSTPGGVPKLTVTLAAASISRSP